MTPIVSTVEVDRPPEVAFAFVIDPSQFPQWQPTVVVSRITRIPQV
jgi:uncharacterized protein YndB with AHSA1/START domain